MCKICEKISMNTEKYVDLGNHIYIGRYEDEFYLDFGNPDRVFSDKNIMMITHCPMCGDKLKFQNLTNINYPYNH